MYYQPSTRSFFTTHSEIRIALNVSFPDIITDADLESFGVYPITPVAPEYNPLVQDATETYPVHDEQTGQWLQQWVITPASPAEIEKREGEAKASNKQKATQLLLDTDWVELPSVTNSEMPTYLKNANLFLSYRGALRAIAVDPPIKVTEWPPRPVEEWS